MFLQVFFGKIECESEEINIFSCLSNKRHVDEKVFDTSPPADFEEDKVVEEEEYNLWASPTTDDKKVVTRIPVIDCLFCVQFQWFICAAKHW